MDTSALASVTINGVVADLGSETLRARDGRMLSLRPQAFAVLRYLLLNSGRLVTKDELMNAVWPNIAVTDDSLVQCIHEIRRAIGDEAHAVLKTASRRGYRLVLPETEIAARPPRRWAPVVGAVSLLLLAAAAAGWSIWRAPPPGDKPMVAVLPFDALEEDAALRRLANGLSAEVITDLARFPEFQVISGDTTKVYAERSVDAIELGKTLNVGYVVEGSIQRQADRVRITAKLTDATNGRAVWTDRWDRPLQDLFAVQTEISEQVSNRLGGGNGVIQATGRIAAHRKPPGNLSAYELYLLGTERLEQVNKADVEEAIRLLKRATELDPGLARAWIELSHCYSVMSGFGADHAESVRLAAEAAERAVMLDPSDAEAHAVLGSSLGDRGDVTRAKAEFDTALRMAPNQFEILAFYAAWASTFGEPERGAELADRAVALNPNYPMWSTRLFAYAYFFAGRYEDTLRMQDRLAPDNYGMWMWVYRAGALAALGRAGEAKATVTNALERFPDLSIEGFINWPGTSEAEQRRLIETMRLAGYPPCARVEALADNAVRLPECAAKQLGAAR